MIPYIITEEEYHNLPKNQRTCCVQKSNGDLYFYKEGYNHRDDGPAIITSNNFKLWFKNGKCHQTDGPACEFPNGEKRWYKEGLLHNTNGPAIEFADGTKEYRLNNIKYSYTEWYAIVNGLERFI